MTRSRRMAAAVVGALVGVMCCAQGGFAQKSGGTLKISLFDDPASMSLLEEATGAALRPIMGVFNNLVMYDQHTAQNSPNSIIPDLATSWSWSEDGKELTFPLRRGVKWHDGKPFTAADVKCTWGLLMGGGSQKLRLNPRKTWYLNVDRVATNGDYEVTFHLKRPQPALLSLLASGWSPIYPCHVSPAEMRRHPIGTGPFKFVEFKPNEYIKVTRNPDYWKPGRPYLDGIEWDIIKDIATRNLTFIAGKFDISSPYGTTVPLLEDVKKQAPQAICELTSTNVARNLILNPEKAPFDNPELRRAVALSLDRKAFIDILTQGKGDIGATMLPPPEGLWGMPPGMLASLPGYDPDIAKNRTQARKIMEKLGYGPGNRLALTLSARNIPAYRDPAVILIDQLKEIYVDAVLEPVETVNWFPKIYRKDYTIAINGTESGVDDPDQQFYENFVCGAVRNYTGYCKLEVDKLIDQQSAEADPAKRKQLVWQIEKKLAEDGARPIIFYPRGGTCTQPYVKGLTTMVNSIYNGYRMEDVWLDR
ncbi:MAG: peptide ABC transporter substrate-binding protein [Alphaproteobacteria bacterium]|nr:peptide ABC transporter substrate-binding protein [Alphaproteobacteria bacterium]